MVMMTVMIASFLFIYQNTAWAGRVIKRQVSQQNRIHQGWRSGELTCREIRRLEREQHHIQISKKRAWADGRLTPKEHLRLEKQQNHAGRHIYSFKHNNRHHR